MELLKYSVISSTQETARQLVLSTHHMPFAVLAETQSGGHGRLGREWQSPPGGLWLTIALNVPTAEAVRQAALVTAFAVAHVLLEIADVQTLVKWPNDLLVKRRKICGILAEVLVQSTETTTLLAGIGINVNNSVDGGSLLRATSLKDETEHSIDLDNLAMAVIADVERDMTILIRQGFAPFQPWMQSHLALLGETITVTFNDQLESGRVKGLNAAGALLLADQSGLIKEVSSGSIYQW
jgi:BirA family biotin operon repressor/biotin-[acetyl-CoA-carboxylase] ligase